MVFTLTTGGPATTLAGQLAYRPQLSKGKQTRPYQLILDVDKQGYIKTAHATSHTSNLVYEYRQEVFYERNKQLRVITYQKIVFMKPENMEVQTFFHPSTHKI